MKYSKKWLQEYIEEALPINAEIEKALNAKAFEVEGIENIEGDSIFDIKVLPNRAHDALGHMGMARELCACLDLTINSKVEKEIEKLKSKINTSDEKVSVEVMDEKSCSRFMSVKIDGVKVVETPVFIRQALENIGQKSVNNIVDITNYVQFTLNKPMHAYDANNIEGGIIVRYAESGEKLVTLDDKELELNSNTLVIADSKKVLGLAGIKGGKYSGVKENTTSIILESANFEPVLIRKTSQKYNLKTDASKRFENGISDQLIEDGLYYTLKLILDYCLDEEAVKNNKVKISEVTDVCNNKKKNKYFIGVTQTEINSLLGSNFEKVVIENTFKRLGFEYEEINTLDFIKNSIEKVIGSKYKNPSNVQNDAPEYFSCSSLVSYLFKGIWMPSMSVDKYVFCNKIITGDIIDESILEYGDLVFANTGEGKIRYESLEYMRGTKVEAGVDHVGVYIGEGKILHSTKVHGKVVSESIVDYRNNRKVVGVGRVSENLEEKRYIIYVPHQRLDLKIKENIIEEVGRIIGYDKLVPTLPDLKSKKENNSEKKLEKKVGIINKELYYQNAIRNILFKNSFSEVMNYSFVEKGELTLVKAASTKNKLRTNISDGMLESVQKNINNMPLLHLDIIKAFEFGKVFDNNGENFKLCMTYDNGKKKSNFSEDVDTIVSEIKKVLEACVKPDVKDLKINYEVKNIKPYIIEIDFDDILKNLEENIQNNKIEVEYINTNIKYKSFSQMPFVIRDVAFWIEENKNIDNILEIIKSVAGDLCVEVVKFDEFKKEIDGVIKTSLGYRLIYQSFDKTLTDEEVNVQSDKVYEKLKELGLEVR